MAYYLSNLIGGFFFTFFQWLAHEITVRYISTKTETLRQLYLTGKVSSDNSNRQRSLRGQKGYYYAHNIRLEDQRIDGGFSYYEQTDTGLVYYQAQQAQYISDTNNWTLFQVSIVKFTQNLELESINHYDTYSKTLPEKIFYFEKPPEPQKLAVWEIPRVVRKYSGHGISLEPYRIEFHSRFSRPTICLLLTLLGVFVGMRGGPRSGNAMISGLVFSSLAILVYYWGVSFGSNLGNSGIIWSWLAAWSVNLVFLLFLIFYYLFAFRR